MVVPGAVAHDDFEQLVHAGRPLAFGHQSLGFGKAGVKVALVFSDDRVKLLQRPVAALVGVHKANGLRPGFQCLKAQRVLDALEWLFQLCLGFVNGAGLDQEAHVVKTGVVVARVGLQRLGQHLQGGLHVAAF